MLFRSVFKDAAPIELAFKPEYRASRVSRAPVVPIHLRAAVRHELEELLAAGIIRPIKPGDKVLQTSRCVVVEKPDGKVRLCVDLKVVNENIEYNVPYPITTITDLSAQLPPNIQFLSVHDMKKGYHQLRMHESAQPHLVFVIDQI